MASAKKGYLVVATLFRDEVEAQIHEDQADREQAWVRFAERLDDLLQAL
jgi:Arc/MetJ family transcription regulator